jgi:hypothetical protein
VAAFLAIPAARVLDLPWKHVSTSASTSDRFWNPGPVMLAHQPIEQRCAACHEVAFEHVRDGACLECHKAIGHHVGTGAQAGRALRGGALHHLPPRAQGREDDAPRRRCVLRRMPP